MQYRLSCKFRQWEKSQKKIAGKLCVNKKALTEFLHVSASFLSGRVGSRTPNLLIRSQMLYPVELRDQLSRFERAKIRTILY